MNKQITCERHCSTATAEVHRTRHLFLTVQADVTPTSVLPAPTENICHFNILMTNFQVGWFAGWGLTTHLAQNWPYHAFI